MSKWKQFTHAVKRVFGGPSHAEQRAQQTAELAAADAAEEEKARKLALTNTRRAINSGRRSLVSWYSDEGNKLGA